MPTFISSSIIALMPEWENKIKMMTEITSKQNVTSLSGVPTWTIVLIKEVLKHTGKKNISDNDFKLYRTLNRVV